MLELTIEPTRPIKTPLSSQYRGHFRPRLGPPTSEASPAMRSMYHNRPPCTFKLACPPITHGMLWLLLETIGVGLSSLISCYTATNAPEDEKSKKFPEVTEHNRACRTVALAFIRTAYGRQAPVRPTSKICVTASGCGKFQMIVQSLAVTRHRVTGRSCLGEPSGRSRSIVHQLPSASLYCFLVSFFFSSACSRLTGSGDIIDATSSHIRYRMIQALTRMLHLGNSKDGSAMRTGGAFVSHSAAINHQGIQYTYTHPSLHFPE